MMLTATPRALADGTVNVTLEDASARFAMTEMPAQAYARAHAVWSQWLRHWHLTGDPRALRTAFVCGQIAEEKLAALQADLPLSRTACRAARAADWPMDDLMQIVRFERTVQIARAEWLATPDEAILADKRHL
jgi:hypothetical protein